MRPKRTKAKKKLQQRGFQRFVEALSAANDHPIVHLSPTASHDTPLELTSGCIASFSEMALPETLQSAGPDGIKLARIIENNPSAATDIISHPELISQVDMTAIINRYEPSAHRIVCQCFGSLTAKNLDPRESFLNWAPGEVKLEQPEPGSWPIYLNKFASDLRLPSYILPRIETFEKLVNALDEKGLNQVAERYIRCDGIGVEQGLLARAEYSETLVAEIMRHGIACPLESLIIMFHSNNLIEIRSVIRIARLISQPLSPDIIVLCRPAIDQSRSSDSAMRKAG